MFGARVHITSLRAATGSGIELLDYVTPRDGRPMPAAVHANDLLHWQTTLIVRDAEAAAQALRAGHYALVSPGVVPLSDGSLGFAKGVFVRDPDGHVMRLVEKHV